MWLGVSPAALSRCGKSNPRWHSCWRSYHLSNLPKRALCSGTFCIHVFPTSALSERIHQLESKATMLQDATVEDARNVITLKQHMHANFHTAPPLQIIHHSTSTWNLHKRISQANELRIGVEIIGCRHGHESDQLLWAELREGPPAHRQDGLGLGLQKK